MSDKCRIYLHVHTLMVYSTALLSLMLYYIFVSTLCTHHTG